MSKKLKTFGTNPNMLHRGNSETSKEAAYSVNTTDLEERVYNKILSFGKKGCISDEVRASYPNLPYSSITARYAALKRKGFIKLTGEKRPGNSGRNQKVMISALI
jgi:hypothetical protein